MVDLSFTIIMQWINFGLLLFLMYILLYKPLMSFLDKRARKISGNIDEALNNKEQSMKVLEEYKVKMKEIQKEADKIFDEARKKAENEKNKILDSAQDDSRQLIDNAKQEIGREAAKAREELKRDFSSLVISCSEKILGREINDEDHSRFMQEFLKK